MKPLPQSSVAECVSSQPGSVKPPKPELSPTIRQPARWWSRREGDSDGATFEIVAVSTGCIHATAAIIDGQHMSYAPLSA